MVFVPGRIVHMDHSCSVLVELEQEVVDKHLDVHLVESCMVVAKLEPVAAATLSSVASDPSMTVAAFVEGTCDQVFQLVMGSDRTVASDQRDIVAGAYNHQVLQQEATEMLEDIAQ